MAFERPTLAALVDRIEADFISRVPFAGAVLRRSLVRVLARVFAGAAHMLHGHLDYQSRQLFPDTADASNVPRFGSLYDISPTPAAFATGEVTITGTNGTTVNANERLLRADGTVYETTASATIASGTATASVTALVAAEDGNAPAGTVLTLESPIAGVDSEVTVAGDGLTGGADQEDVEAYRNRIIARLREAPQGGDRNDYEAWALEVPGVTRVWVSPKELGAGTVIVRFVRDNDSGGLIPDAGEVADVQAYLDERAPVTATVTAFAPVSAPLDFTVSITPDNADVRASVEAELEDLLLREAEPGGTVLLSRIRTAIGVAAGLTDYTLTSPAADVTHASGELATMGTITWL